MLHSFKLLLLAPIRAMDGLVGHVHDAILDDQDWRLRHFLVRLPDVDVLAMLPTGHGLSLVPGQGGLIVDSDGQTARGQRASSHDLAVAERAALAFQQAGPPSLRTSPEAEGMANLRSCREICSYWLAAPDGDIGEVEDLAVDSADWTIRGVCFSRLGVSHLIPVRDICRARWRDRTLATTIPADLACRAPMVDRAGTYDTVALRRFEQGTAPRP